MSLPKKKNNVKQKVYQKNSYEVFIWPVPKKGKLIIFLRL